ncbi:MAG: DUF3455 domain-containing protein [Reyranellaceae bacterium]
MKRLLVATLAAASTATAMAMAAPAPTLPGDIPAALRPATGETLAATLPAKGVQIYECRVLGPPRTPSHIGAEPRFAWKFVAPEADLFDGDGEQIGVHGAGPYWQAVDGSRLIGEIKARIDAPTARAIPWLLLAVTSATGPAGRFSRVTSIQRIDTNGGTAPVEACTPEFTGVRVRMPYSATYRFFSPA